jgi:AraC-like DNA-binding protein
VLWLRLRRAVEQVQAGATLTQAAALAGFSDSAHLTRVFRTNFGLPPSAVLQAGAVPAGRWPTAHRTPPLPGSSRPVESTATFKPEPGTPT